jgi:hypothetical protein
MGISGTIALSSRFRLTFCRPAVEERPKTFEAEGPASGGPSACASSASILIFGSIGCLTDGGKRSHEDR